MIRRREFLTQAGSLLSLLFLWPSAGRAAANISSTHDPTPFEEFSSSCIDLGRYDAKARQLTVRFVNRKPERFYRYSNVPPEVWAKLRKLNESGGVGEYLNNTIVTDSKEYPFEELIIREFKIVPGNKKAGNSK